MNGGVNGSSGAAIMLSFLLLLFMTLYMGFRIFRQKKYFTYYWCKQFGKSNYTTEEGDIAESKERVGESSDPDDDEDQDEEKFKRF